MITQKVAREWAQLVQFRTAVYGAFQRCADAVFELINALAADTQARSPAELSLSRFFRRQYASVYDELAAWKYDAPALDRVLLDMLPPREAGGRLWAVGETPRRRQYAPTVADRAYVHYPNPVGHNAPITIGHSYGALVHVDLEEPSIWAPAWTLERTPTDWTGVDLALEQIARLVRCDDGGHALVSDSRLYNARAQAEERLGQLYVMRGKEQIPVPRLHTGDIGAVTKLTHALTGDTRCDKGHPSSLPSPVFPLPLFAVAANFGLALVNVAVLRPRLQASRLSLGLGVLNAVEAVIALALAWWYLNRKDVRRLFRDRG